MAGSPRQWVGGIVSVLFGKFLLIAALLGLWSGPVPNADWKAETEEKGEWAATWISFAVLEGVRANMEETETSIANGALSEDALGFSNFGAGILLASVPDLLLLEINGPAQAWQPAARGQYAALRRILTDRESIEDPLESLQTLPTKRMFTALNFQMMAHGGFSSLEIEQLRQTMVRSFDER